MRLRSLWRFVRRACLAVLTFALLFPPLYNLAAPEERGTFNAPPAPPAGSYRVLVVDWGYHTAIFVEQPSGWKLGPPGKEGAPFLEYSWGDRLFYMESDYRPQALFATLVLPTATVAYIDGWPDPPRLYGARAMHERIVDATTLRTLLIELERTFRRSGTNRLAPYPAVSGYGGRFYPAYGYYFWTHDCNWWTVTRLRVAGLARGGVGVLFSGQVQGRLREFRRVAPDSLSSAEQK